MNSKELDSNEVSNKLLKQLEKTRQKKIKKLKTRIGSGKYHVDAMTLARALFMSR